MIFFPQLLFLWFYWCWRQKRCDDQKWRIFSYEMTIYRKTWQPHRLELPVPLANFYGDQSLKVWLKTIPYSPIYQITIQQFPMKIRRKWFGTKHIWLPRYLVKKRSMLINFQYSVAQLSPSLSVTVNISTCICVNTLCHLFSSTFPNFVTFL